jgi:lysophospholipase L1-like esterase
LIISYGAAPDRSKYRVSVVAIGDSICYGVGGGSAANWEQQAWTAGGGNNAPFVFRGSQVNTNLDPGFPNNFNEGYPFAAINSGGFLELLGSRTATVTGSFNPDVMVMAAGTNDIGINGASADDVIGYWSAWMDQCSTSNRVLVVCGILRRLDDFDTAVQVVNAGLQSVIDSKPYSARVINISGPYYGATDDADYIPGGLHPNPAGYVKIGNVVWEYGLQPACQLARG